MEPKAFYVKLQTFSLKIGSLLNTSWKFLFVIVSGNNKYWVGTNSEQDIGGFKERQGFSVQKCILLISEKLSN